MRIIVNSLIKKIENINVYSKSAIWVAVDIKNEKKEKIFLKLKPGFLNQVSFFSVKKKKITDSLTMGSIYTVKDKLSNTNNFVFEIEPGEFTHFVRVKTDTYLPFSLKLLDKKSLYENEHFWNIIKGFLFGALILTIFYNLLLYFSVRDSTYLYYLVFVFFAALTLSYHFGICNQYIWGRYPVIGKHITILYSLFIIGVILFTTNFLDLRFVSYRAYKSLQFFIILIVGIIIFDMFGFHFLANASLMMIYGIVFLYIFIIALRLVKKGNRYARFFSLSWLISIFSIMLFAAQNLHIFSPINRSFDILIYGGYVYIIMLSLVIGNKLNIYSKEKEDARNKELIALRERDNTISEQKIKLEEIVKERNIEIINKNLELSKHQKEIENQTSEIRQKNQKMDLLNQELTHKNKKIEVQNINLQGNKYKLEKTIELRTKELEKEKERATIADSLKTTFLNNLSREIKTPMNAITGFATLILNKSLSIAQRNEYLQTIIQNVDALLSLIDDIVTLSRIQAGVFKVKKREIDLKALIKLITDEFIEKLKVTENKDVQIIMKIPVKHDNIFIKSDHNKLWLIYKHLLENSIKYTNKGTIEIGFNILENSHPEQMSESVTDRKNSCVIEFFVKDTGKGMTKQDIDKHIVKRQTNINKYKYRQDGLGLAIVVGLVDIFNGKINVVSEEGKGTGTYIKILTEITSYFHIK